MELKGCGRDLPRFQPIGEELLPEVKAGKGEETSGEKKGGGRKVEGKGGREGRGKKKEDRSE